MSAIGLTKNLLPGRMRAPLDPLLLQDRWRSFQRKWLALDYETRFQYAVLASIMLRGDHPEETRLTRWMKQRYRPVLQWTLAHRSVVLAGSAAIVLGSLALLPSVDRKSTRLNSSH